MLQREEEEEGGWEWEGEKEWEVGVEMVEEVMAKEDNNFHMKSEQPLVYHVINHKLTMRAAGQRVQPLAFFFSVYSFVSMFLFTPM